MKISLEWLGAFVDWVETDPQSLADRLTLSSAEVEDVETQGALLEQCCVGKVLSLSRHPNADKLTLADVETDKGVKRVVCGGTNLKEGMLVAFAHIGATVKWHGGDLMTLAPVKIRGEASEGMICAGEELGLESICPPRPEDGERPIINLSRLETENSKLQTGAPLRSALGLTDTILHFSNTAITNRPDLFSHLGFARECVALGLATWKKGQPHEAKMKFPKGETGPYGIKCVPSELVTAYAACMLHVESLGETPEWMKLRLAAMGNRSINLPVDITNYVMWELGVPLHAFDANQIQGKHLTFRESNAGEKIVTLDEAEHTLPAGAIVLEDAAGIFDLCGIKGGKRSASHDAMTEVYLHAPVYDPVRIRKAVQATNHRTDASTIYEKGVPPAMAIRGLLRALELFLELCPGAKITSALLEHGDKTKNDPIDVPAGFIDKTLGIEIPEKEVTRILESLGCNVSYSKLKTGNSKLVVIPPDHRRDLKIPADIADEVARIHGFDRLPDVLPHAPIGIPAREKRLHGLRESLRGDGYFEILPLSLLSPQLLQKCGMDPKSAVKVANPLGEEFSLMQPSTLPQLLVHAEKNLLQSNGVLKTFHWGHVFTEGKPEKTELSLLCAAKSDTSLSDDPFLRLKQDLTYALSAMKESAVFTKASSTPAYAHPGRHASITLEGKHVGDLFEVHPGIRASFGLDHRAAAAVLDLSAVLALKEKTIMAMRMSQFPSISYDVTLPWTQDKPVGELLSKLSGKSTLLEKAEVADLYRGKQHADGEYNLTLRFTYRAKDRTLTEEEAKKEHEGLMSLFR